MKLFSQKTLSAVVLTSVLFSGSTLANSVQIDTGSLKGGVENGVQFYKGIPYASAPVGKLRWMPPQPAASWLGERDASQYATQCAQNVDLGVFGKAGGSEDCLYLNVFAPENAKAGDKLPVFFWIPGGSLFVGAGDDYDPTRLAREGKAVVVTINYRLGVFGFFAHPEIDKEGHPFANYGYMDQNFALDWVQRNIAQFGGDAKNVTISGESSGGNSAITQMLSPWSKDKFQHVIAMSGSAVILKDPAFGSPRPLDKAQAVGERFAKLAGCEQGGADCLRQLSTAEILKIQTPELMLNQGVIDGNFRPEHPADALKNGRFNKVTFINGTTAEEGNFFVGFPENETGKAMDEAGYRAAMEGMYGKALAEKIRTVFPPEQYPSYGAAHADAVTSSLFACVADQINRWTYDKTPTYAYEFADRTAPSYLKPTTDPQGAAHTSELTYIFQGFHGGAGIPTVLNPLQDKLSSEMIQLWTTADKAGTPSSKWQSFDPKKENYLTLRLPESKMVNGQFRQQHHCDFWDKTGIY
ncbi:carboxylesterase family protein [Aggregatibacter actinomycetemcomitans]|nr:carboxylesterase family protein [Aggregatibacter actinomycetemcomitans]